MLELAIVQRLRDTPPILEKNLNQERIRSNQYEIRLLKERCKGCSFCIDFCPQHTLVRSSELNSHGYHLVFQDNNARCNGCGICTMVCPEFAIHVVDEDGEGKED